MQRIENEDASEKQLTWSVDLEESAVESLHQLLFYNDMRQVDGIQFLVDRFKGMKVSIFANEHPPPHFCVTCGSESANYRISDCVQLNGGFKREYRIIKVWHSKNKEGLVRVWNERRPSDCPVGEYRED